MKSSSSLPLALFCALEATALAPTSNLAFRQDSNAGASAQAAWLTPKHLSIVATRSKRFQAPTGHRVRIRHLGCLASGPDGATWPARVAKSSRPHHRDLD